MFRAVPQLPPMGLWKFCAWVAFGTTKEVTISMVRYRLQLDGLEFFKAELLDLVDHDNDFILQFADEEEVIDAVSAGQSFTDLLAVYEKFRWIGSTRHRFRGSP